MVLKPVKSSLNIGVSTFSYLSILVFPTHFLFLSLLTSFCLLVTGVEGYCCNWSHLVTHTHTHSVNLLWTMDRPFAENSTWQHTTLTTNRHPCPRRIRTRSPSKRAATDPHLKPRGHKHNLFVVFISDFLLSGTPTKNFVCIYYVTQVYHHVLSWRKYLI